jgi:hypothetical protein
LSEQFDEDADVVVRSDGAPQRHQFEDQVQIGQVDRRIVDRRPADAIGNGDANVLVVGVRHVPER